MSSEVYGAASFRDTIGLSSDGDLTVPARVCAMIGIEESAECFIRNNEIIIRPVKDHLGDSVEGMLLTELREKGLSFNELSEEYMRLRAPFYAAVREALADLDGAFESGEGLCGAEMLLEGMKTGESRVLLTPSAENFLNDSKEELRAELISAIAGLTRNPFRGTPARKLLMGFYAFTLKHGGKRYDIIYRIFSARGKSSSAIFAFSAEDAYKEFRKRMK